MRDLLEAVLLALIVFIAAIAFLYITKPKKKRSKP